MACGLISILRLLVSGFSSQYGVLSAVLYPHVQMLFVKEIELPTDVVAFLAYLERYAAFRLLSRDFWLSLLIKTREYPNFVNWAATLHDPTAGYHIMLLTAYQYGVLSFSQPPLQSTHHDHTTDIRVRY